MRVEDLSRRDRDFFLSFIENKRKVKKICKGKLNEFILDIQNQLSSNKPRYVNIENGKVTGFAVIEYKPINVEIIYLCSNKKGGGSSLLKEIEFDVKQRRDEIILISHKDAVKWWKKKGFKMRDKELLRMVKPIKQNKESLLKRTRLVSDADKELIYNSNYNE